MNGAFRRRAVIKFLFWTAVAALFLGTVVRSHLTGQMAGWYYYRAAADGYAVNADTFKDASEETPAILSIGSYARIEGLQAVRVKKGDRLPANCNGVMLNEVLEDGGRARLEGTHIRVTKPFEIHEKGGLKFRDSFKHAGTRTNPWAAVWNVLMVAGLGLSLGFMAEGFTDTLGIKFEKIRHFEDI